MLRLSVVEYSCNSVGCGAEIEQGHSGSSWGKAESRLVGVVWSILAFLNSRHGSKVPLTSQQYSQVEGCLANNAKGHHMARLELKGGPGFLVS